MDSEPEHDGLKMGWEKDVPTLLVSTLGKTRQALCGCCHAQTLEAYSTTYKCTVWIPLPCKQWKCRFCAEEKIRQLASKTQKAKPNRLLTLTVDPKLWDNPRAAFDGTRRQVSELGRKIRQRHKEFEYLRVTELTRGGWPHYHLLVRSPYLPHSQVKAWWEELTGAIIVDLRQVKGHFDTFYYLVKYLSKLHQIGWTDRHVSYSRHFFPEKEEKIDSGLGLTECTIVEAHPGSLFYYQFRGARVHAVGYNVFALSPPAEVLERLGNSTDAMVLTERAEPCSQEPTKSESASWSQKSLGL